MSGRSRTVALRFYRRGLVGVERAGALAGTGARLQRTSGRPSFPRLRPPTTRPGLRGQALARADERDWAGAEPGGGRVQAAGPAERQPAGAQVGWVQGVDGAGWRQPWRGPAVKGPLASQRERGGAAGQTPSRQLCPRPGSFSPTTPWLPLTTRPPTHPPTLLAGRSWRTCATRRSRRRASRPSWRAWWSSGPRRPSPSQTTRGAAPWFSRCGARAWLSEGEEAVEGEEACRAEQALTSAAAGRACGSRPLGLLAPNTSFPPFTPPHCWAAALGHV